MTHVSIAAYALLLPTLALVANQDPERIDWDRLSRRLDADGDGRVTREEFPRRPALFRRLDRDRDGVLTAADFGEDEAEAPVTPANVEAASPEGLALFEAEVRPILESNCFECHAETSRRVRGGLRVDSRAGMLAGGASGPALAPGDPERSLLVEAVRCVDEDLAMPPDEPLAPEQVAAIERWVELGAPWPGEWPGEGDVVAAPATESRVDIEAGREWWSFQPVVEPPVPEPARADWALSPIDAFLLERMEAADLEPVGDADRGAWLRRVTFDLTGLPPTPEALAAFERDSGTSAYEKVVDELLASPRYAERWGRHWLDVARYAESSGRDSNVIYPHAWRYRDWVIEAFERDLPYDRFLEKQLAGDLLPAVDEDAATRQRIATGYLALGPKSHNTRNPLQFTVDVVDEQIDAISQGMLGMTFACARCHDHKFDPVPTEDYYALAGILGSTETLFGTYRGPGNNRASDLVELSPTADLPNGPDLPRELRRYYERRREGLERTMDAPMERMDDGEVDPLELFRMRVSRDVNAAIDALLERYDENGHALPTHRLAMGVREGRGRDARVLTRGELDAAGARVARGFPQVLTDETTPEIRRGSGRLELASWIASAVNPLTARVWVNRVWSHLFGAGLVPSHDNFGKSGQLPTHPELLDWLAATFVEDGWSTRALIRRVVLSRAYRLDTAGSAKNERVDPEASLVWRMPARRLEAEALRDAMLYAAGTLDLERPEGSPVAVLEGQPRREGLLDWIVADLNVRSVYLPILRDRVPHALECFDAADPSFVTGAREETVAATQALYLMNDEDVIAAADALARRVLDEEKKDDARIARAFQLTLSREPTPSERTAVKRFLREFERLAEDEDGLRRPQRAAWSAFAQSLFQSAEFRFRG